MVSQYIYNIHWYYSDTSYFSTFSLHVLILLKKNTIETQYCCEDDSNVRLQHYVQFY